jgi:hypothetical protein
MRTVKSLYIFKTQRVPEGVGRIHQAQNMDIGRFSSP